MSHSVPASIFRAYDIRGIYNETLTDDTAYLVGRSIGSEVLAQGQHLFFIYFSIWLCWRWQWHLVCMVYFQHILW